MVTKHSVHTCMVAGIRLSNECNSNEIMPITIRSSSSIPSLVDTRIHEYRLFQSKIHGNDMYYRNCQTSLSCCWRAFWIKDG